MVVNVKAKTKEDGSGGHSNMEHEKSKKFNHVHSTLFGSHR